MTSNRFRPGNFQPLNIPAAKGLINSAIAPQRMSLNWAQDIENFIPVQAKKLSPRKGLRRSFTTGINGESIIHSDEHVSDSGELTYIACTDAGNVYTGDGPVAGMAWTLAATALDTDGVWGSTFFNSKIILFNGLNTPLVYDGITVSPLKETVFDNGTNITYLADNQFEIDTVAGRGISDYPAGTEITLETNTGPVTSTVLTSSFSDPTATITLTADDLAGVITITSVSFTRLLPAFRFIYAAHDRLWALAPGELAAGRFTGGDKRMLVYYTDSTNNEAVWSNENTMDIPYINLADKHHINDELIAIAAYQGNIVFFGKFACQIWGGTDPTFTGDFSWGKTVNVGLFHPFLLQEFEQDLLFYTRSGIRSFTRVYQTGDIETREDLGSVFVNQAQKQIEKLFASDLLYKRAKSCRYPRGNMLIFRLSNECHVHFINKESSGWVRFTGMFSQATSFVNGSDNLLYIGIEDDLYVYAVDENRYNDNGLPYRVSWWTPWVQPKIGARWANKKLELEIDPGAPHTVYVRRFKNNDDANYVETEFFLAAEAAYWDEADWDVDFWDGDQESKYAREEDKFIAYTMSFQITTMVTDGPIDIVSLNLFGKTER